MAKSKWKVQCNTIGGKYLYIAYRVIDMSKPVHSGNIEHHGEYTENKEEVQKLVDELNAKESNND